MASGQAPVKRLRRVAPSAGSPPRMELGTSDGAGSEPAVAEASASMPPLEATAVVTEQQVPSDPEEVTPGRGAAEPPPPAVVAGLVAGDAPVEGAPLAVAGEAA